MSAKALPCIVCGVELDNVTADSDNQPSDGTAFWTSGHYGSTFFDPMDGQQIEITVCDDCLRDRRDRIGWHRAYRLIKCASVIVGRERLDRPLVPFTEQDGEELAMEVEPEQLGHPWRAAEWYTAQFAFARHCYETMGP